MIKDYKGRTYRQMIFIYRLTVILLIGLGIYDLWTGKTTGGVIYGRYGGATSVSYGGYGFLIMAGILLFGHFVWWVTSKSPK